MVSELYSRVYSSVLGTLHEEYVSKKKQINYSVKFLIVRPRAIML